MEAEQGGAAPLTPAIEKESVKPVGESATVEPTGAGEQVQPNGVGEQVQPQQNGPGEQVQVQPQQNSLGAQAQPNGAAVQAQPSVSAVQPQPTGPDEQVQPNGLGVQSQPNGTGEHAQPNALAEQAQPNVPGEQVQPQPNTPGEQVQPQPNVPGEHVQPQPNVLGEQVQPSSLGEQAAQPNVSGEQAQPNGQVLVNGKIQAAQYGVQMVTHKAAYYYDVLNTGFVRQLRSLLGRWNLSKYGHKEHLRARLIMEVKQKLDESNGEISTKDLLGEEFVELEQNYLKQYGSKQSWPALPNEEILQKLVDEAKTIGRKANVDCRLKRRLRESAVNIFSDIPSSSSPGTGSAPSPPRAKSRKTNSTDTPTNEAKQTVPIVPNENPTAKTNDGVSLDLNTMNQIPQFFDRNAYNSMPTSSPILNTTILPPSSVALGDMIVQHHVNTKTVQKKTRKTTKKTQSQHQPTPRQQSDEEMHTRILEQEDRLHQDEVFLQVDSIQQSLNEADQNNTLILSELARLLLLLRDHSTINDVFLKARRVLSTVPVESAVSFHSCWEASIAPEFNSPRFQPNAFRPTLVPGIDASKPPHAPRSPAYLRTMLYQARNDVAPLCASLHRANGYEADAAQILATLKVMPHLVDPFTRRMNYTGQKCLLVYECIFLCGMVHESVNLQNFFKKVCITSEAIFGTRNDLQNRLPSSVKIVQINENNKSSAVSQERTTNENTSTSNDHHPQTQEKSNTDVEQRKVSEEEVNVKDKMVDVDVPNNEGNPNINNKKLNAQSFKSLEDDNSTPLAKCASALQIELNMAEKLTELKHKIDLQRSSSRADASLIKIMEMVYDKRKKELEQHVNGEG